MVLLKTNRTAVECFQGSISWFDSWLVYPPLLKTGNNQTPQGSYQLWHAGPSKPIRTTPRNDDLQKSKHLEELLKEHVLDTQATP